uniref:Nodule-specific cysteine-rich peptide G45 n=1 Tax=Pisum sativum TaxID=3888 RepID=A0A7T8DV52_PEA|nr:nodule-specific cysteine-rich peptide G45 [Pisum sativum]
MNFKHYKGVKQNYICCMQRDTNMTETFKFIYVIILFLTLFLVAKTVDEFFYCEKDFACPPILFLKHMCMNNRCVYDHMENK